MKSQIIATNKKQLRLDSYCVLSYTFYIPYINLMKIDTIIPIL